MSNDKCVIAITGPTGAGKSTIGEKLAKQLGKCVNIDADHIKHMMVDGFYKDETNPGGWGYNQWELVGESIGLLAVNFLDKGYKVVVNGYIDEPAWASLQNHVTLTHKFLLLPQIDTVTQRDAGRSQDVQMGSEVVKVHHAHFSEDKFFQDFTKLDTTNHSIEETISQILRAISPEE